MLKFHYNFFEIHFQSVEFKVHILTLIERGDNCAFLDIYFSIKKGSGGPKFNDFSTFPNFSFKQCVFLI